MHSDGNNPAEWGKRAMKLSFAEKSDVGRKRDHNEDSRLADGELNLFIVADGMGGHEAGEVASRMAVDVMAHKIQNDRALIDAFIKDRSVSRKRVLLDLMEEAVQDACTILFNIARRRQSKNGLGTTMSSLLLAGASGFIAHVGDSRIYLQRDGELHQISEDHSLLQEQVKRGLLRGKETETFKFKNVLTRGVGIHEKVQVDTMHIEVMAGDRFILCSDGLHGYLKGERELLRLSEGRKPDELAQTLIDFANEAGGKDNISAVVVDVEEVDMSPGEIEAGRKLEVLRRIPMFARLNYQELVRVLDIARIKHYEKDSQVIREGEDGDRMFVLVNGKVKVEKEGVELAVIGNGGHFGEMALIDREKRSATVTTLSECDALEIEIDSFEELLHAEAFLSVKILRSFLQVLSLRLRDTSSALSEWRHR